MGSQLARAKIDGISLFLFYTGRDRQEKNRLNAFFVGRMSLFLTTSLNFFRILTQKTNEMPNFLTLIS